MTADHAPLQHEPDEERGVILFGAPRDAWRICKRCLAVLKPDGQGGWTSSRAECGEPDPMPPGGMYSWERGAGPRG